MDTKVSVKTTSEQTPIQVVTTRPKEPRFPWHRLTLSLMAIGILMGMWRWYTFHLYALPEYTITAYSNTTNNIVYVIGGVVIFFISGKIVWDWKNTSASTVTEAATHLFEKKDEKK